MFSDPISLHEILRDFTIRTESRNGAASYPFLAILVTIEKIVKNWLLKFAQQPARYFVVEPGGTGPGASFEAAGMISAAGRRCSQNGQ